MISHVATKMSPSTSSTLSSLAGVHKVITNKQIISSHDTQEFIIHIYGYIVDA